MDTPGQRARFLGLGVTVVALYVAWVATGYAAKVLAGSYLPERVARAARLDPLNAAYPHILGRFAFFERQDFPAALENYRRAAALNPYSARYWLDLANTQQIMARPDDARHSLEMALSADPTNPAVAQEAANHYLVLGDTARALRLLNLVAQHTPQQDARGAIELAWRATQDARTVMDQMLPRTPDAYLTFLQVLMERQQTQAAALAWRELLDLKQPVPLESSFGYIQYLIDQGEVDAAKSAWDQLVRGEETLRGYTSGNNLLTNGGFEEDILNGGFGWRYESSPHVALAIDQRESYRGRRALSVSFDGEAVRDVGIYQFLPVEPGAEYRISARIRTEGMEGAGGPRVAVFDRYSRKLLFLSDEFTGSSGWRELEGEFRTDPDTKLVMLRIVRVPGTTRVRGKMWLDEAMVVRK